VESDADHRSVSALPIDFAQGYRYARPQPLAALLSGA
jgi:EAL domain-containing protein (putative c-di-GMP-specific phosphodiesterase class I)